MNDYNYEPHDDSGGLGVGSVLLAILLVGGFCFGTLWLTNLPFAAAGTPTAMPVEQTRRANMEQTQVAGTAVFAQVAADIAAANKSTADAYLLAVRATEVAAPQHTEQASIRETQVVLNAVETSRAQIASTELAITQMVLAWTGTAASNQSTATVEAERHGTATAGAATQAIWQRQQQLLDEQIAVARAESQSKAESIQATGYVRAFVPWALIVALAVVVVYMVWMFIRVEATQRKIVRDAAGNVAGILDERGGSLNVLDMTRNAHPVMASTKDGPVFPVTSPELQATVTQRAQITAALYAPGVTARLANEAVRAPEISVQPPAESAPVLPDARWNLVDQFRPGNELLIGAGPAGLLTTGVQSSPHLLVAGTTGSGKSRYLLRPALASALVNGWQVAIIARSPLNFSVFGNHPNARIIRLPDDNPGRVLELLKNIYQRVIERKNLLDQKGQTTWDRWSRRPEPPLLVAIAELANLYDELTEDGCHKDLWRLLRMGAREGRAAGIYYAVEVQDPTRDSIDLAFRRQSTPVVFRTKDPTACQAVFHFETTGLPDRHFRTNTSGLIEGVGFDPSDAEITGWVEANPVTHYEPPGWIEAQEETDSESEEEESWEEKVIRLAAEGLSKAAIQREVFGSVGGAAYEKVNAVLQRSTTGTTTSTTGGTAETGINKE